ncbi:hypothetical protein M430DRAFT_33213 [Amorphotheca resinae ATCC 22711]|uniref:Uncharacterized protein n=1 Tax=Amorphotheca resinae ATCC 22711 TaxID=857342 RepID=A0A2T3BBA0_AMORE|nr:hypothetical protein M430DRAFT_33213 [Amorphotheca resinae ATCC 22711]PSS25544.1 hypothetical protein M430DRAFT_33213 [Amorphotheca resinae ATCC 22711]
MLGELPLPLPLPLPPLSSCAGSLHPSTAPSADGTEASHAPEEYRYNPIHNGGTNPSASIHDPSSDPRPESPPSDGCEGGMA